jgi:GNAT superfamily N-acetyltransferase
MTTKPEIRRVCGSEILPDVDDIARFRSAVLRDFPYLCDESSADEAAHVRRYAHCAQSVIVLASVDERIFGESSAMPLLAETAAFHVPFIAAGYDPAQIFFGSDPVLLPEYRGSGVYRQFFLQREAFAAELGGFEIVAVCAVERADDHRLRPRDYIAPDAMWARYGYVRHPELVASVAWKDIDSVSETEKPLVFWLKKLTPSVR